MLKKKHIKKEINDGMEFCNFEPDGRELKFTKLRSGYVYLELQPVDGKKNF